MTLPMTGGCAASPGIEAENKNFCLSFSGDAAHMIGPPNRGCQQILKEVFNHETV